MRNDKRILLIDDEEVITFGFCSYLQEPGVEVESANTLEEALTLISLHQYDAAVVDLRLSNSTAVEGFECIKQLRALQKNCKIIVMTAYGGNGYREEALKLGVNLFFEKPIEPEVIKRVFGEFGIYEK